MIDCSLLTELVTIHELNPNDVNELCDHIINLLCSNVLLNLESGENEIRVDVGFGYLIMRSFEDKVIYQFEPSQQLRDKLQETLTKNVDPLACELKSKIDKKLQQLYKELLK